MTMSSIRYAREVNPTPSTRRHAAGSTRADPGTTAETITQRLTTLMLVLDAAYAGACREVGLTPAQGQLLCAAVSPSAIGDLAAHLGCDRSNITHLAQRAEARGWLHTGTRTDGDGRIRLVRLSDDGSRLAEQLREALVRRIGERLDDWERPERALLDTLAARLAHTLG